MKNLYGCDGPMELSLERFEGELLGNVVEQLINELGEGRDFGVLKQASEKLGDANAVARWSREKVWLDLNMDEAIQLVDALLVRLEEDEWPDEEERILGNLRERMIEQLTGMGTAVLVGDRRLDSGAVCVVS